MPFALKLPTQGCSVLNRASRQTPSPVPAGRFWGMTQACRLLTDGSPEAQRGADTGEVTQRRGALPCGPPPGPDSFINPAPPTAPDGGSIPSAPSRPRRGSPIKKNGSVHKSLPLLSLPSASWRTFRRERRRQVDRSEAPGEEANAGLGWRGAQKGPARALARRGRCGPGQSLRVPQEPGFRAAGLC